MSGALLDRPQILTKKKSAGYIKGFSVSSFLQVIELEQKSCNLMLRANGKKGCLFIRNGNIINAKTVALRGEKAAIDILGWKNAQIKLSRPSKKIKQAIRSSLTRLILAASRRKKSETEKAASSNEQLEQAIHLVKGNHFKKAHTLLTAYLRLNPSNSMAWLWYSRCLGNLQTISETLAKCIQLTPNNLKIIEEIHKLKQAYQHVKDSRVRRCPFCWSPLNADGEQCHYCKSGLVVSKAIDQNTQHQIKSKFLISAVTRYTDVVARENNVKAVFYLSLANLNLNKANEALDLLNEVSRINPDNKFLSDQLNIVVNHVAARLPDYTKSEERAEQWTNSVQCSEPTVQAQKKKILVVEDSPTTRKVIVLTLKQKGYAMVEARDGLEALGKINEERPDLVLLDIILPKMDGYQILSIIKKTPELKDTPVILLTSKDGMINKVKGRLAGSTDYLTKPFETTDLIETVCKHIG
jgi:twitching motility two-component system response regulator PilG